MLRSALESSLSSKNSLQQQQYSKSLHSLFLVHLHLDQCKCFITHWASGFLEDLLANVTAFSPSESTNIHRLKIWGGAGVEMNLRINTAFLSHLVHSKCFQKNPQSACTQCRACSCCTVRYILFPYITVVLKWTKAYSATAVHNCRVSLGEQSQSWPFACESC